MQYVLNTVGMQIERDSIMPASGHREVVNVPPQQPLSAAAYMVPAQNLKTPGRGQGKSPHPFTQSILPVTYMTPALAPTITQPYQAQFSQLHQSAFMRSMAPQHTVPAVRMHAEVPTVQSSNVTWSMCKRSPPLPGCNVDA
jgi:hypothetical protein